MKLDRSQAAIYSASGIVAVLAVVLIVVAIRSDNGAVWASPLIALCALAVALGAQRHSARSADAATRSAALAEEQERNRRYGWVITLRPDGATYELRNVGTASATNVLLAGEFTRIAFIGRSRTDDEEANTVNIAAGEARAFHAVASWGDSGHEVTITWKPHGETERTWVDVVPTPPNTLAEIRRERDDQRVREEQRRHEDARDIRELILRLGDAYADWKADQGNPAKKLKVQLLVAALPPSFGREIGYQVDVARDVWGSSELPFTGHVREEDQELIVGLEAEIELMWNMRTVAGYRVYGPDGTEGPDTEPRIWWALTGYADRVRERESGERKL
ncbi:hypothetical protein GOARA_008_00010, partial [Gordonia araii NBRC 100433]